MFLFWGPDHICFYNDAARFRDEGRHPFALGKKGRDVWPERWSTINSTIAEVCATGKATWTEDLLMHIQVNDQMREVYSTFSYGPVYDEWGEIAGVLVTGMDTTAKVKSLKKAEQSEQHFRNLLAQAPVGIAILKGPTFIFESANENFLRLTPQKRNVIGLSLNHAFPETARQFPQLLTKVFLTGISYRGNEYPIMLARDGKEELHYINFIYEPMKESDGVIRRIMVVVNDVTELVEARKRSEEAQRELGQMADAMPQLVWVADADGRTTYLNQRISQYAGAFQTNDGCCNWDSMCHPDDLETTRAAWNHARETGTIYENEHRMAMPDGSFKWHLSRACPYKDEHGTILKWFGTSTDIDEHKRFAGQLEQRVMERTRELQQSNQELSQFAYVASHDLQEPLRKISTYIDFLRRTLADAGDTSKTYLEKIASSSQRMATLIRDILHFSQLSRTLKEFSTVDLNVTLHSILSDLELAIHQKQAVIISDPLPVIQAIPLQLNQLFYNLISNALKFVRPGVPPQITVTSRLLTADELPDMEGLNPELIYYLFQFRDNGIGFDEKYSEQIFALFQRLHSHQVYSGTGIGLALCKKIVINHNGLISATSRENEGSVFSVVLPALQPAPVL
jgi:PAS domain S-box-containing protein